MHLYLKPRTLTVICKQAASMQGTAKTQYTMTMRSFAGITRIRQGLLLGLAMVLVIGGGASYWLLRADRREPEPAPELTHAEFMAEEQALVARLQAAGSAESFALLRQRIADNPSVARECHPLLHMVGHAAFEHYKGFADALANQDELCNSGYIHGVIEAAFEQSTDWTATMQAVCPAGAAQTYRQWQCFHGVGHGLMYAQQKDVPKSLALCEQLPTQFAVQSCANGVFMEKFIVVSHTGKRSHTTAPGHAFCKEQSVRYKADCYIYAPTAFLADHPNQYHDAFNWCNGVERGYTATCAQGVGSQAMKENITRPAFAAALCTAVAADLRLPCIEGAVVVYIHNFASTKPALELCRHQAFIPFKQTCEATIRAATERLSI